MKLLRISVDRGNSTTEDALDRSRRKIEARTSGKPFDESVTLIRIESIKLSLIEAEIFFDQQGAAKLMEKSKFFGTQMLMSTSDIGYWNATDDEMDILRKNGYPLPDWRNLSIADIAKQYPEWINSGPKT
jgi:hypothetical protein